MPYATVLMPAYNAAPYLKEAIDSILNQTFTDFEFLIFDDGSTDATADILKQYTDPRIRVFHSAENQGLVRQLNRGIDLARGKYIFRMDADDYSLPERFARQIAFMEDHPEIGFSGSWVKTYGRDDSLMRCPETHEEVKIGLLSGTTLLHNTIVFRTSVLREHGVYYDEEFLFVEDFDLWVRLTDLTRVGNLPEVLAYYRIHETNVGEVHNERQEKMVDYLLEQQFVRILRRRPDELERKFITLKLEMNRPMDHRKLKSLVDEFLEKNRQEQLYDQKLLEVLLPWRLVYMIQKTKKVSFFLLLNAWRFQQHWPHLKPDINKELRKRWRRNARMVRFKAASVCRRVLPGALFGTPPSSESKTSVNE